MTPEELERQVNKNTIAIKTVSDSLTNYVQNQQLDLSNKLITANTSDIESLRDSLNSIQTQINLQNRIASMKDANIVDPAKLDLLQYDGDRWSNIAASKVVTGLLGKLTDLQDVEVSDLRNDNALAWDSEKQKWVNKNLNTELYDDIYISKIKPDSTPYEVWFKDSAIFGAEGFASGLTGFGGKVDKYGHAEFDSLTLRKFLEVPELRYNRVEIQVGDKWNAPGAGVIESVEQLDESTGTITLKLEDGEYGAVAVGDLCMGIFHSETTEQNADADSDDGRGTRQFAGFYTVYFEVTNVLDINNKRFGYKIRDIDDYWTLRYHPCAGMNFVAFGNKSNVDRQTSCYSTRTYTRYLIKQDTWDQKAVNIAMQFGDLSNLNVLGLEMEGYSAYLNSVYFTGTITQVKPSGQEVRYANDRGPWEPDTFYDYYDRVSVEGYLYLCVNVNGTTSKPSEDNPDWLMQVSKGDQGEGLILQRSEWEPNRIYRNESEVNAKVQPERYIDIVLVRNWATSTGYKVYRCIFVGDEGQGQGKHLSSSSNAPGTDGGAAYWEELAQNVGSIYTDVIIAKDAQLDFITGNSLRIGYSTGETGYTVVGGITGSNGNNTDAVGLWLGDTEENRSNADFRVTFGGHLIANNASITGTIVANEGTLGVLKLKGYLDGRDISGNGVTLYHNYLNFVDNDYASNRQFLIGTYNVRGYNRMGMIISKANSSGQYLPNYGIYVDVSGSQIENTAMSGNGTIAMNGDVVGYQGYRKTLDADNTVFLLDNANNIRSVILCYASANNSKLTLPSISALKGHLGETYADTAYEITYLALPGSTTFKIVGGGYTNVPETSYPIMLNKNSDRMNEIDVSKGDSLKFIIFNNGTNWYANIITESR